MLSFLQSIDQRLTHTKYLTDRNCRCGQMCNSLMKCLFILIPFSLREPNYQVIFLVTGAERELQLWPVLPAGQRKGGEVPRRGEATRRLPL